MTRHPRNLTMGLALFCTALMRPALSAPRVTAADPVWLDRWFAAARFDAPPTPGVLLLPQVRFYDLSELPWDWGDTRFIVPIPSGFGSFTMYTDDALYLVFEPTQPLTVRAGDAVILVAQATAHLNPRAIEAAHEVSSLRVTIDGVDVADPKGQWVGPRPARFPHAFLHLAPYLPAGFAPSGARTSWWPDAFLLPSRGLSEAPADVSLGGVVLRIEGLEMGEHEISWRSELSWDRVLPAGQGFPVIETHQLRVRLTP